MAVAVVDALEIVHINVDSVEVPSPQVLAVGENVVQVPPVIQPGQGIHIGVHGLQLRVDEEYGDGHRGPAHGEPVEKALEDGAKDAGNDEIQHREELDLQPGFPGYPGKVQAVGVVREQGNVADADQAAPPVNVILRNGEEQPRAKQGRDHQHKNHRHRDQKEAGGGTEPADAGMEPEVHIQAPEAAQGDGAHKQQTVERIGQRPAAGERFPVNQEGRRLHDAAADGNIDHQIVQNIPGSAFLYAAQPGCPEEEHEKHTDAVDRHDFGNVNGFHHEPPFLSDFTAGAGDIPSHSYYTIVLPGLQSLFFRRVSGNPSGRKAWRLAGLQPE